MLNKFIRKYSILYTVCRDGGWYRVRKKPSHNRTKSPGNQSCNVAQRKHRMSQLYLRLSTQQPWDGKPKSFAGEYLGSQGLKLQLLQGPVPRPLLALPSMFLVLGKKLSSFSIY